MLKLKWKTFFALFIFAIIFLISIKYINSPGQSDIQYWVKWIRNSQLFGIKQGFKINNDEYPPIASVILYIGSLISYSKIIFDIKLTLFIFLCLSSFIAYLWTKNLFFSGLFVLTITLSTILSYLDVLIVPPLLLSFWALSQRKYIYFSIAFTIATFIKWQPIIIVPFLIIYILDIKDIKDLKEKNFIEFLLKIILPTFCIICIIFLYYGSSILISFIELFHTRTLSGQALNMSWIITYFLHIFSPHQFGPLVHGYSTYIMNPKLNISIIQKILFLGIYGLVSICFLKEEKTFKNLIKFSLIAYVTYFIFSTDVHENHLFIASLLSSILCFIDQKYFTIAILVSGVANLNLFLFGGINGKRFPHTFMNIDLSIVIACIYVLLYMKLVFPLIKEYLIINQIWSSIKFKFHL